MGFFRRRLCARAGEPQWALQTPQSRSDSPHRSETASGCLLETWGVGGPSGRGYSPQGLHRSGEGRVSSGPGNPSSWWALGVLLPPPQQVTDPRGRRGAASSGAAGAVGGHRACGPEGVEETVTDLGQLLRERARRGGIAFLSTGVGGGGGPGWGGWWAGASFNLAPGDPRRAGENRNLGPLMRRQLQIPLPGCRGAGLRCRKNRNVRCCVRGQSHLSSSTAVSPGAAGTPD